MTQAKAVSNYSNPSSPTWRPPTTATTRRCCSTTGRLRLRRRGREPLRHQGTAWSTRPTCRPARSTASRATRFAICQGPGLKWWKSASRATRSTSPTGLLHRHRRRGHADPRTRPRRDRPRFAQADHRKIQSLLRHRQRTQPKYAEWQGDEGLSIMRQRNPKAVVELTAEGPAGPGVYPTRRWRCGQTTRASSSTARAGRGQCPYCGTQYRLKAGELRALTPGKIPLAGHRLQWIGDAVMSQPLLTQLASAARGAERVSWHCPGWRRCTARCRRFADTVIELPFAHGRLDWAARRRIAAGCAAWLPTPPTCCQNSLKAAL